MLRRVYAMPVKRHGKRVDNLAHSAFEYARLAHIEHLAQYVRLYGAAFGDCERR